MKFWIDPVFSFVTLKLKFWINPDDCDEPVNIEFKIKHAIHPRWKMDGAVASAFIDELHLKIDAKIMLIHNIDTVDSLLTNGQLVVLIAIIKTSKGRS